MNAKEMRAKSLPGGSLALGSSVGDEERPVEAGA